MLTGWEYKKIFIFQILFLCNSSPSAQTGSSFDLHILLSSASLPPWLFFCSCEFVKSNPIFELSFLFWGMCHFQNSSQCSSVSFVMEPEWHFACFVIFFLIVLFPLSLFLLGSCWAVRCLSPFKLRFPFLTSQVVLNCFYMGRKAGDSICLCSLFLCSADFPDSVWLSWLCSNTLW